MAARDDYPALAAWSMHYNVVDLEARAALGEIDRLRLTVERLSAGVDAYVALLAEDNPPA